MVDEKFSWVDLSLTSKFYRQPVLVHIIAFEKHTIDNKLLNVCKI